MLDQTLAEKFAHLALGHVTREYPNKLDHVLSGPGDVQGPRDLHPIFFGSFDWHSCVHGYWLLARLRRLFPGFAAAGAIKALFDAYLCDDKVAGERAYLTRPLSRGFERPYGWAWLLALAAELDRQGDADGQRWAAALAPLARDFADRFRAFLPLATYPVRAGTHGNTAFALTLALDYAHQVGDAGLAALIGEKARAWHGGDRDAQAWEPSQDDFLSPTLIVAELMRHALPADDYAGWLAGFLPRLAAGEPAVLFTPAVPSDRSDGKIAHLDGLNLSRAWCWRGIAGSLPAHNPARTLALDAADRHLAASLPHVAGDYMGEHWLATFALLALGPAVREDRQSRMDRQMRKWNDFAADGVSVADEYGAL